MYPNEDTNQNQINVVNNDVGESNNEGEIQNVDSSPAASHLSPEQLLEALPKKQTASSPAQEPNLKTAASSSQSNSDLLDIKKKALKELSILIDNLDQPPEQRFRTLMMIIQETDNPAMINKAYETALQIKSEKERAQAILAITHEINYFTSGSSK